MKPLNCIQAVWILLLLTALPLTGLSQTQIPVDSHDVLTLSASLNPPVIRDGEYQRLEIDVRLKSGWHIYSVIPSEEEDAPPPTTIAFDTENFSTNGPLFETRPIRERIEVLDMTLAYHRDHAVLYQNLSLKTGVPPGQYQMTVAVRFQLCTDSICLPTDTRHLPVSYQVEAGSPRAEYLAPDRSIDKLPGPPAVDSVEGLLSGGFWAFIALAALMGLVSLLTPCVFPMIPITVTFFSKQAEGDHRRVIKLAIAFAAGIIFTYTVIGLLLSFVFGAGSALQIASNPVVNLMIAAVFIVFALSLIGLFQLKLPAGLEAYFDGKARSIGGITGVLLMGFTFTLTAFTCTVQFVGTMLIAAAQGEWMWPLIGMLVFSTVFSFPFFLLAVAPSLVKTVQGKSGPWLGRSKVVLGFLELMASIKFLSNADLVLQTGLISRNTAIAVWIAFLVIVIGYLVWTGIRPIVSRSPIFWLIVIFFIGITVALSRGWNDRSLGSLINALLPPPTGLNRPADSLAFQETNSHWLDSYETALTEARNQGKPLFVEFTGYTCINCRWMEQNILARSEVAGFLHDHYILVRLYTDGGKSAAHNLQLQIDRFKTVALPFYAILSPDGSIIRTSSGITHSEREFLAFLKTQPH